MFAYRSAEPAGHEEMRKHRTSTGKPAAGPTAAPVMKHRDYKGETHLWTQRINRISENVPFKVTASGCKFLRQNGPVCNV